jgi:hypothetical protein
MALVAPSIKRELSEMRFSRSFWYSRMPLANILSMGPADLAFCVAAENSSFKLLPDQKSFSKFSLSERIFLSEKSFLKMTVQLVIETVNKTNTTN